MPFIFFNRSCMRLAKFPYLHQVHQFAMIFCRSSQASSSATRFPYIYHRQQLYTDSVFFGTYEFYTYLAKIIRVYLFNFASQKFLKLKMKGNDYVLSGQTAYGSQQLKPDETQREAMPRSRSKLFLSIS